MYFSDLVSTLQNISKDEKAIFVSGSPARARPFRRCNFVPSIKKVCIFLSKILILPLRFRCSAIPIPRYSAIVKAGMTFSVA